MNKQVVLLRVGIDAGCGGMQGPLFNDGTFEFICVPDDSGVSSRTYGNLIGRYGKPLVDYFPESRRWLMAQQSVHVDPEFDTFTYGDPTIPKRSLRKLKQGDFLVFYCGLQPWDSETGRSYGRPALYLAGYFEVARAGMAVDFDDKVLNSEFENNDHVCDPIGFQQWKNDLVLVKGGPGSRLFRKSHLISSEGTNRARKPLKVLAPKMQKVFGSFGGYNSIERSPPRWVHPDFVDKAIAYLKKLE